MKTKGLIIAILCAMSFSFVACDKDNNTEAPVQEIDNEITTHVELIFTAADDTVVKGVADKKDGLGEEALTLVGKIHLKANTKYTMSIVMENRLVKNDDGSYIDQTKDIREKANFHQFYFGGFAKGTFSSPAGTGNIGEGLGEPSLINYLAPNDPSGLPVGLNTSWTTGDANSTLTKFHVLLKHKPGLKKAGDDSTVGSDDFTILFQLNVVN